MYDQTSSPAGGLHKIPLGGKLALFLSLALTVLFLGYVGFCAWVSGSGVILPHTYIAGLDEGTLDLGGMTADEAMTAIDHAFGTHYRSARLTVAYGAEQSTVLDGSLLTVNDRELTEEALAYTRDTPFLLRGIRFLFGGDGRALSAPAITYTQTGEGQVTQLLSNIAQQVDVDVTESSYTKQDSELLVQLGTPGARLDTESTKSAILSAFQSGQTTLTVVPAVLLPRSLSAESLNAEIYSAPVPLSTDASGNMVPAAVGLSIDVDSAQAALDAAAAGETVSIPLVRTQPDYSEATSSGVLYQDLLSQCVTNVGGTSARLSNVTLAAQKCNGKVLLPGDTFDYNKIVGKRTQAAGFKAAPAYVQGETVNEIGGGICQVSSSLYYCTVYANLQVVSRINHRYAVGYVPDGLDATVSWGGPEYRFKNNTDYPIKIVAFVDGRSLTVQFYGTNVDGTYVKTERTRLSTTDYTTVYQADSSIAQGTTKEKVTPYTGRKVTVYRSVYSADGTLLSRTLENTSDYKSRNKVILYHPADAASLGLEPSTPPAETTKPAETSEPSESPAPSQSAAPTESPAPAVTESPTQQVPVSEPPSQALPAGAVPLD